MAASVTLQANQTNNTPYTNFALANSSVGDVIVVITHDTATGGTCKIDSASGGYQLEGLSVGSAFNGSSGNRDNHTADAYGGGMFVNVWSARVEVALQYRVTTTYGGTTGTRRSSVYVLKADTGKTVPVRATRLILTGNKDATSGTGGNLVDAVTMSGSISALDVGLIVATIAGAGSSGTKFDADNSGARELTTNDYNTTSCTAISSAYAAAASNRPSATTENVEYVANPTVNRTCVVTVWALEAATSPSAGNAAATGAANNATVIVSPNAGATATGAANDPIIAGGHTLAEGTTATGAAYDTTVTITTYAELGTGGATAFEPTVEVATPPIGVVTETDTALDFTATKIYDDEVNLADPASGDAIIKVTVLASMTETADAGDVRLTLRHASADYEVGDWVALTTTPTLYTLTVDPYGAGTGYSVLIEVRTNSFVDAIISDLAADSNFFAGVATGTGFVPGIGFARPEFASATAAAFAPTATIAPHPAVTTATGVSEDPTVVFPPPNEVRPDAECATATGTAYPAGTPIPACTATGVSEAPKVHVAVNAECATATATVFRPVFTATTSDTFDDFFILMV